MTFLLDECLLHSLLDIAYWCVLSPKVTSLQEVLSFSCCQKHCPAFILSNLLLLSLILFFPFISQSISFKNDILDIYCPLLLLIQTQFHVSSDFETTGTNSPHFNKLYIFLMSFCCPKNRLQQLASSCVTLVSYFDCDRLQTTETS